MKIRVSDIPEEGLDIDGEENVEAETGGVAERAAFKLRVDRAGTEVRLRGTIEARLSLGCGRCLERFERDLSLPVDLVFLPAEDIGRFEGHELARDELNTGFYRADEIDLAELTGEQVLLGIPMKPLCSESCKGICPVCGTNLNERACGCSLQRGDERMQALKQYFERRKE
ncbi:MAG: DUF177 domain-containing protein [Nitrospirota bacterium]|jgi:uncharacterized protein